MKIVIWITFKLVNFVSDFPFTISLTLNLHRHSMLVNEKLRNENLEKLSRFGSSILFLISSTCHVWILNSKQWELLCSHAMKDLKRTCFTEYLILWLAAWKLKWKTENSTVTLSNTQSFIVHMRWKLNLKWKTYTRWKLHI